MPAVVDARKARPQTAFAWLVEEAFAPLVRLHPAVSHVIPVAWRRWRKSLYAPATWREISASLRLIGASRHDEVIDVQGDAGPPTLERRHHDAAGGVDRDASIERQRLARKVTAGFQLGSRRAIGVERP